MSTWKVSVEGWQEYSEWVNRKPHNWRNFTPIALDFELADYLGRAVELHAALLGFHLRVQVYHAEERRRAVDTLYTETGLADLLGDPRMDD